MGDREHAATITVEQAGALLGISRRSAYRAAATGHLPTIRIGRRILVPTALLHRMLGMDLMHDPSPDGLDSGRRRGPVRVWARPRLRPQRRKRGRKICDGVSADHLTTSSLGPTTNAGARVPAPATREYGTVSSKEVPIRLVEKLLPTAAE